MDRSEGLVQRRRQPKAEESNDHNEEQEREEEKDRDSNGVSVASWFERQGGLH